MIVAVVAVLSATPAVSAGQIPRPDYTGKIRPHGHVAFRIVHSSGKRAEVRFEATSFEVRCEDGSTFRRDFRVRSGTFTSRTVFEGYADGRFGGGDYYRFHGRLLPDGRARGFLFDYINPFDPPPYGAEPECSTTGGKQRWTATQRGGAE